jgi:transcriptional regulator with XRE-family HTH domain
MKPRSNHSLRLGNHVKHLREQLGLTQAELSKETARHKPHLSRSYISRIEGGEVVMPSKDLLESLARALRTTTTDLLSHAGYIQGESPSGEFELALDRLKGIDLTPEEKEDILLAIEIALGRHKRRQEKNSS